MINLASINLKSVNFMEEVACARPQRLNSCQVVSLSTQELLPGATGLLHSVVHL